MNNRGLSISVAVLASVLLAASVTQAATITVTNYSDSDPGSLRAAILAASNGDTIAFAPALVGQTISLSTTGDTSFNASALLIAKVLTIDGSAAPGLVITGNSTQRIFIVAGTGNLTLTNITLANGRTQGGNGGAGYRGGGGGAGLGGLVFNQGALSIVACNLNGGSAVGGNGGGSYGGWSGGGGGGLNGNGQDEIGSFTGGAGGAGGGGNGGSNNMNSTNPGSNGTFGGGGGGGNPGGLGAFGGGGGGYWSASAFAGGNGGSGNTGGGGGAGLGGAIFNYGGTLNLTNSTLTGNSAIGGNGNSDGVGGAGYGGGLFSRNGTVSIIQCTIAGNTAAQGGGGIYNLGDGAIATLTMNNTIVANSTSTQDFTGNLINGGTNTTSGVGNLVQSQSGFAGTIISTADPVLGMLASNGGPTQTLALLPGSPCLDAATTTFVTTDQRGVNRDAQPDVGAFESRGFTISFAGSGQRTNIGTTFALPLIVSVSSPFGETVNGGQVLFTAPVSGASGTFGGSASATIADGFVALIFTANLTYGNYVVTASIVTGTVIFDLTNGDPPTISGTMAGQAVNDNATLAPFSGVTIGDVDAPAETLAVSVQLDNAGTGTFSVLNGFTSAGAGLYTFSGTAAAATTAISGLVFKPTPHRMAPGLQETTTFTISVSGGIFSAVTDSTTTVVVTAIDVPPTLISPPTATPNPAFVGQTVSFVAIGSGAWTYSWDFNDGTKATGPMPTHAFGAVGSYTVGVTVTDEWGGVATASVTVTVNAVIGAGGVDSDGDGFNDQIETALGSDPNNPASTPMGKVPITQALSLPVSALTIKLDKTTGGDAFKLIGSLLLNSGLTLAGQKVIVDLGGVVKEFTLDKNGASSKGNDKFRLNQKTGKNDASQVATFTVVCQKGAFASAMAAYGLSNATTNKTKDIVPVTVIFNGILYQKAVAVTHPGTLWQISK